MKIFWLNDGLTIKADNIKEREALAVLLEALPPSLRDSSPVEEEPFTGQSL